MKRLAALFALLLGYSAGVAQLCSCPTGTYFTDTEKPKAVFTFSNGNKIGVCGSIAYNNGDTTYSEFCIFPCGTNDKIDEWSGMEPCKLQRTRNALLVKQLYGLPVGPDFAVQWLPFYIYKYYYEGNTLKKTTYFDNTIKKYTGKQINAVLAAYKQLDKNNSERSIEVARLLFWSYVSGSKQAEVYLSGINEKFGPFDGAIAEEWDDLWAKYELWKEKNKPSIK